MSTDMFNRRIFFNPEWDSEFKEKGYIKVPFLSEEEVQSLVKYYKSVNERDTNYNPDYAEFTVLNATLTSRRQIFEEITSVFKKRYDAVVENVKPVIANFVHKESKGQGAVPVHQNWAVVDEDRSLSMSIWVPLTDCSEANGTLHFVAGSHKTYRGPRGAYADELFADIADELVENYLEPVTIKAGEAIFLDDSIIHYSHPNMSEMERLAIQLIVVPEEEQIIHYRFDEDGSGNYDIFGVDHEYFLGMVNWKGDFTNYKKIGRGKTEQRRVSLKEFKKNLSGGNSGILGGIFRRIFGKAG